MCYNKVRDNRTASCLKNRQLETRNKEHEMAKTKAKAMKQPKKGQMVKVEGIRINKDKPNAAVKFKVTKFDKATGNMVVRASCRGEPRVYVKIDGETGKAMAGVRGEAPVAAKDPAHAFQKAVKRDWA
jgi:hypothetical protein